MWDIEDVNAAIEGVKKAVLNNIRRLTRLLALLVVALLLIHQLYPPLLEWIGQTLNLEKASLASIAGLIVGLFVLERLVLIEKTLKRPPIQLYQTRIDAYKDLGRIVKDRNVRRVDLLQFSGYTVRELLREVAERSPSAHVRLLVAHPDSARQFDKDGKPDHSQRISTSLQEIEVIKTDFPELKVESRFYRSPASLSAIIFDQAVVCVSWYHCYPDTTDPAVLRIRGHMSPTITALDQTAQPFISFAKAQFEVLWQHSRS